MQNLPAPPRAGRPCLRDHLAGLLDAGAVRGPHQHGPLDFTDFIGLNVLVFALKRPTKDSDWRGVDEGDNDAPGR